MQKSKGTDQIAGAEKSEKKMQNKQRQRQSSYWCNRQVSYKWEPTNANSFICFSFFVSDFPRAALVVTAIIRIFFYHSNVIERLLKWRKCVSNFNETLVSAVTTHHSIIIKWCKLLYLWIVIKSSGMRETTLSVQRCGLSVVTRDMSHLNSIF